MAEKMLRNVSELMLASVSHYEILEVERFGPKFAPIRTAVCLFFFVGGGRVPTSSGNHGKPGKSRKKFHAWKNHGI